jgi:hypothetical protein
MHRLYGRVGKGYDGIHRGRCLSVMVWGVIWALGYIQQGQRGYDRIHRGWCLAVVVFWWVVCYWGTGTMTGIHGTLLCRPGRPLSDSIYTGGGRDEGEWAQRIHSPFRMEYVRWGRQQRSSTELFCRSSSRGGRATASPPAAACHGRWFRIPRHWSCPGCGGSGRL